MAGRYEEAALTPQTLVSHPPSSLSLQPSYIFLHPSAISHLPSYIVITSLVKTFFQKFFLKNLHCSIKFVSLQNPKRNK
jgi:hypothetical protein